MGCIGFPAHPVWEVTQGCNLACIHCHASSGDAGPEELTTEEGFKLLEEIASVDAFRMLVLTGGEPLVRKDLFELLRYAGALGLKLVIATNGTLITDKVARRLKEAGVVGVAISLDAADPAVHNFIRDNENAFDRAMRGIEAARKAGLVLQLNYTATKYNIGQLEDTIDLVNSLGGDIMLAYQLVAVGRGQEVKTSALAIGENRELSALIRRKQRGSRTIIEPVAGPQYWPYLMEHHGKPGRLKMALGKTFFHGCAAGRGFVYVKANGDVWPCPFVEVSAGNVRRASFVDLWKTSDIFVNLRNRATLKGRCGECQYHEMCGGCRGRAWATTDDYLAEDPLCFINQEGRTPPV
jgi:radical SAM protein with 4Fe4S-binding SPASM domain